MSVIGKVFKDTKDNHVVILEAKNKTPESFMYPIAMYKIKYMALDREKWISILLFNQHFKEVRYGEESSS